MTAIDGWVSGIGLGNMGPELKSHKIGDIGERKFGTVVTFSSLSSTYLPTVSA
jgi:hypothetical protein